MVSCFDTNLLVDAGISCRRIVKSLELLDLTVSDLTAILITHTHSDHIAGLQTLLKRTDCPVCATERAVRELCWRFPAFADRMQPLTDSTTLGDVLVTPAATSHDAPGSCGYRLDTADGAVGVLTDTGYITDEALEILPGVDLAVLESNHDVETLCSGPYPDSLKQRVLGLQGHLSNEDAAQFAVTLAEAGLSDLILAHLSQENNTPAMARNAFERALSAAGYAPRLTVAPRETVSHAYSISRRVVCRK